ncbi:hypothetical protein PTSG_04445 [Salpingoeca rosetta]|uniref:Uncharacterized protein n=1 Tax=Salpingoeca rosetta (strain ATCC 50818 / BSB-021) TaxID=946362 RepID=F2U8K9_SALR5|nr:uncharacterized protein PTSG_04445 [Salpingoeca rosetta]EGD72717.1 hypothetical protein PTSG_04445 [Salpingoeca rosetta]|eukprot:XP_004994540.1 hypothetical protein PTSG_04445 [Salpingoeca rosetta]
MCPAMGEMGRQAHLAKKHTTSTQPTQRQTSNLNTDKGIDTPPSHQLTMDQTLAKQLEASNLKDAAKKTVRDMATNGSNTHVILSGMNIDDAGVNVIAEALRHNDRITWLDLANNNITTAGVKALARVLLIHPRLTTLSLASNDVDDDGALCLADVLRKNPRLSIISLHHNRKITHRGREALRQVEASGSEVSLDIRGWHLTLLRRTSPLPCPNPTPSPSRRKMVD